LHHFYWIAAFFVQPAKVNESMVMKQFFSSLFAVCFLLGCTVLQEAAEGQQTVIPTDSMMDMVSFIDHLQVSGATVTEAGKVSSDSETQRIKVNGEDVLVDEYDDHAAAVKAASFISPDGGKLTMPDPTNPELTIVSIVEWISTPHIYHNGRIIAHYIGDNPDMIALLESILGPQFAGGVSENKLRLEVMMAEPAEGAPMSFEEAFLHAQTVVLAEVTAVAQGADVYVNPDKNWCWPTQWVTIQLLKVYKGTLAAKQTQTIVQHGDVTDMDTGCGDNPDAEKVLLIVTHDPLYEVNQRYLLALSPLANALDPNPEMAAANAQLYQLVETLMPSQVPFNGRLLVEQGGQPTLSQAEVFHLAFDDYGRTIPGASTGKSLADYEVHLTVLP
jgi:hypothetical protein